MIENATLNAVVRFAVALMVGSACGTLPLVFGICRKKSIAGAAGYLACTLAGLASGLVLALPVAVLLSAAIVRLTRKPVSLSSEVAERDQQEQPPFPFFCTVVFAGAIVYSVSWLMVLSGPVGEMLPELSHRRIQGTSRSPTGFG